MNVFRHKELMRIQTAVLMMCLLLVAAMSACGPPPTTVWDPTPAPIRAPPTEVPTAAPTRAPTGTAGLGATYNEPVFGIALQFPSGWLAQEGYERRYAGPDGFFQLGAISAEGLTVAEVAENEAQHKLQPYGSDPTIETLEVQGREARLILPSTDQPAQMEGQAGLVIEVVQSDEISGQEYNYLILWADQDHIREIAATVELEVPKRKAIQAVLWALSCQFRTTPSDIELVRWESVDWPDGCLGVPLRTMCTQAIVPGYRLIVEIDGQQYEYRSDREGVYVLLAAGPDHGIDDPVLTWEDDEEDGCQSLMLSADGRAAVGSCGAPHAPLRLFEETRRLDQWAELQSRFEGFKASTHWGRVVFRGYGKETATPAWESAVAAWARLVHLELQSGRSGASWATALRWNEELADNPGFCKVLSVDVYGVAFASTARCDGGEAEDVGRGWLTTEELEQLDAWFYGRSAVSQSDLHLSGMGSQRMNGDELRGVTTWAAAVYDRLASP